VTGRVVAAVVLAAGASSRLGQPKQLLPLKGRPLLGDVVDAVRDASVDLRYIVLGHASDEIRRAVDLRGYQILDNPEYETGQSTSLRCALDALDESVDAVLFVLGDQPGVPLDVINRLLDSYRDEPALIVQPRYKQGRGNPVLFDRSLFAQLRDLRGDTGARPILRQRRDQIRLVDASEWDRPEDVDTWEDYRRVRLRIEGIDSGAAR
jgi:molybdenum cofactor cytidylyltransferase